MSEEKQLPDPSGLLAAAKDEMPQLYLDDYIETIHELRAKCFTFRQIADWLTKRGVQADHNSVWRVYAKRMSNAEMELSAVADRAMEIENTGGGMPRVEDIKDAVFGKGKKWRAGVKVVNLKSKSREKGSASREKKP